MHTFADPLRHALRVFPERTATVCGDVRHTYLEFVARCRSLGGVLDEIGIGRGDRVAIWADNSHQYVEVYAAVPACLLYTSPSPRDGLLSRMPSSA